MNKLLIICGPTATGKTALALTLAKKFNGELVSADSRQVYIGMDIGTGKDVGNSKFNPFGKASTMSSAESLRTRVQSAKLRIKDQEFQYGYYDIDGIKLWLLDVARPDQEFSVAHYQEIATKTIQDIQARGKLPIVVGGTGLYIKSIIDPPETIHIPQDKNLREKLENKSVSELAQFLQKKNPKKWEQMNNSDRQNPRRLIRAIEVAFFNTSIKDDPCSLARMILASTLGIGLTAPREVLYQRIDKRVDERVKFGIVDEIHSLLDRGYTWDLPAMNTLGYPEWTDYFLGKTTINKVIERWKLDEHAYARRQRTWFKKQSGIKWFDISTSDYRERIERLVNAWYTT